MVWIVCDQPRMNPPPDTSCCLPGFRNTRMRGLLLEPQKQYPGGQLRPAMTRSGIPSWFKSAIANVCLRRTGGDEAADTYRSIVQGTPHPLNGCEIVKRGCRIGENFCAGRSEERRV